MEFDLSKYVKISNYKYIFADLLMSIRVSNKSKFLDELNISYSSFRGEKRRKHVKNDNINRILKKLEILELSDDDLLKYQRCINRLYNEIYFKEKENIKHSIELLNTYIDGNNFLKPVLCIFRIFAIMNYLDTEGEIIDATKEDYEYISIFKKDFFIEEFEVLYESIRYTFSDEKDTSNLKRLSNMYPKIKWIGYSTIATMFYLEKKNEDALEYYEILVREYNTANHKRCMLAHMNMCFCLNATGKYSTCINECNKSISHVYSSDNYIWVRNLTLHYLFANFMLNNYKEIIDFYSNDSFDLDKLNWVSTTICILASYLSSDMSKCENIIKNFENNENISYVLEYIHSKNITALHKLKQTKYIIDICEKLSKTS